jgi:thiol-disulfide isomerase/thioredoxin
MVLAAFLIILSFTPSQAANTEGELDAFIGSSVLTSETGRTIHFIDFLGKPVFVNFWGVWCPPCMLEMPSLRNMQNLLGNDVNKIEFLFISTRQLSCEADTKWLKENGIRGENLCWTGRTLPVHAMRVPTSYVFNKTGQVSMLFTISTDWEVKTERLRALIHQ